jgi:hypothetical protein
MVADDLTTTAPGESGPPPKEKTASPTTGRLLCVIPLELERLGDRLIWRQNGENAIVRDLTKRPSGPAGVGDGENPAHNVLAPDSAGMCPFPGDLRGDNNSVLPPSRS